MQDLVGGYDCQCAAGCTGDPFSGCLCGGPLIDPCSTARCGLDALCIVEANVALCQCPAGKPNGDPLVECSSEKGKSMISCPVCSNSTLSCTSEGKCKGDFDCSTSSACIRGKCVDPCSLRAACGDNAICKVVIHKPRCECPQCFIGRPHVRCRPDPACQAPPTKPLNCVGSQCGSTQGPCKFSLVINQQGELTCPDHQVECRVHNECPSNQACANGRCRNPCGNGAICPAGKECQVLDHKAVCICTTGCNPSASICFKDRGCPSGQACVKYKCQDPCKGTTCPGNTPCIVEDHKALCKFCPPGFSTDANYGCVQGTPQEPPLTD